MGSGSGSGSGSWHMEKRANLRGESSARDVENVCLSIVVLGASGDLAKKAFPALFNLFRYLINDKSASSEKLENVSKFLQLIKYVSGSYDSEEGFRLLDKEILVHELSKKGVEGSSRRLFLSCTSSISLSICLQDDQALLHE